MMRTDRRAVPRSVLDDGRLDEWSRLMDDQSGMVHVDQLAGFGVGWPETLAQIEADRWNRFARAVYTTFTGPLPRSSLIAGALLYGGPAAVLSHRTAAEEWGMVAVRPGPVHVTVPYGASAITQAGLVVVHRSRAYRHIVVATCPPRTSSADTAIDIAVEQDDALRARTELIRLITDGSRVRLVDVERRLAERRPRRYRRALLAGVAMVRDGVHSALEDLYLVSVEQAHGLPGGRRQVPLSVDGQTLWEDVTYDDSGFALTVRLDGRSHLRADVAFRDRRRDNAAELLGRARLVFGWRDVSTDPCGVAQEVAQVLRRLGWERDGASPACAGCGL